MSGVLKGVGKTFRRVAKVVKRVAPIALGIGAIVFTAGAALGATPTFGAAMGTLTKTLGLEGALANVVTGSLTQAGYGAAIGAATSAITGGDVMKGMQGGALTGAITGGVTGGLGGDTDPIGNWAKDKLNPSATSGASAAETAANSISNITGAPQGVTGEPLIGAPGELPGTELGPNGIQRIGGNAPSMSDLAAAGIGGEGKTTGFLSNLFDKDGWLERNQTLTGHAITGIGGGMLKGMMAESEQDLWEQREKARLAQIRNNYGAGSSGGSSRRGLLTQQQAAEMPTGNMSPAQRFSPTYYSSPRRRFVYDQQTGQIKETTVYA